VEAAVTGMTLNRQLTSEGDTTTTSLPATLGTVRASWQAIEVPVLLITAQLLLLAWLLLFLIVADAAEARGPEVALAKMRGRGRWRTLTFSLAEPVILLAVALPAGVLAGWAITAGLGHILFRPGTPVGLPRTSWLAAAAAVTEKFLVDYDTYSYTESAKAYVGAMNGLITAQLATNLQGLYSTPGVAKVRTDQRQTSTGTAVIVSLRTFGPSSLTFIVTGTQHLVTAKGSSNGSTQYAITVTGSGTSWLVNDIELSSAGQF